MVYRLIYINRGVYKCKCQPTLKHGLKCLSNSVIQMQGLEYVQGHLLKQRLGFSKRSHNTELLKVLNID